MLATTNIVFSEYGHPSNIYTMLGVRYIGGQTLKFEDGQWITESGVREVQALERRNLELEEENNLLKLKIETLLDMLTETSVEYQ
uniref:Chibby homolog 1 (Drosophila) n=1 Tax=Takifugu rubripes TaxID=31033 RepID=H2V2U8_TAKRU